ncbi:Glycerate kinase, partial [Caligus rogercresseyi]
AVCFIGGGETVVSMDLQNQTGSGGRNQELVLSFIQVMNQNKDLILNSSFRFEFMSCGTDGIDGPTDAGGALFSYRDLYEGNDIEVDSIEEALWTHDSYGYFSRLNGGRNHFKPGHTGTNVLDLHILKIWLEFPKRID